MKKSVKKSRKAMMAVLTAVVLLAAMAATAGCNSKSGAPADGGAAESTTTERTVTDVKTIKIGIGNSFNPMCYVDEDGNLQGYDYETLKKIDELLPQYEFEYEPTEFKNILVGLDTDNYDIAVHHYGWNEERAKKYLYGEVGNFDYGGYTFRVAKGSSIVIGSEEDLGGLKIAVSTSSNVAYLTEKFNADHPDNPITIIYDDGTTEQHLASLNSGIYDGLLSTSFNDSLDKAAYGDIFDVTGSGLFYDYEKRNGCYFIYNYGDEQLKQDIDAAQQELLDSGWQKELSEKILGADYTVNLSK
ncbi:transporter substrate-binding domain-containing protein [Lacrimispora sp.]|uniref:transporter substrate-binding domain-containing protein n=1 Tax=Lacrimispora sp. TaxID=2719234 RepID=UPI0028AC5C7A|nr:transporter substrate-binding domain-containing protein [Lacrimispora sp.]